MGKGGEWQEECERCAARGDKKPEKPLPVERREKTPVEYEEWIGEVKSFDSDELGELEDATDGVNGKKQKSRVLFDTMREAPPLMDFDAPPPPPLDFELPPPPPPF